MAEFSDRLSALRAAYETYKGGWEGTFFHDWLLLQTRHDPELLDRMQRFLRHLEDTNNWALLPFYMVSTAELNGRFGQTAVAAALLERATDLVKVTGALWWEPEITRLRARFGVPQPEESHTLLQSSLARAREQGAKLWELRAAIDLAVLLRDQGKPAQARDLLEPIYRWFGEGLGSPDVVASRTLLSELGSTIAGVQPRDG